MEITKERMIEVCERNGLGMTVNTLPGLEEIMNGFTKVGEAVHLFNETYQLIMFDIELEKLFK